MIASSVALNLHKKAPADPPRAKANSYSYISVPNDKTEIKTYAKIYSVHKYWSRKPWYPIAECIRKYSRTGDTVLDMFMGSGVTGLEAIILQRNFIGYDLNPMSTFIAQNTASNHFNINDFKDELARLISVVEPVAKDLYSVDDVCDECGSRLMLKHANIGPKHKGKETACLFCYKCTSTRSKIVRKLTHSELKKSSVVHNAQIKIPDALFPKRFYKDRFSYKGISKISDMYTKRNYNFLGILRKAIIDGKFQYRDLFLTGFSNTVLHASKLKSENVRPLNVNNYWVPDDYFEENPWFRYLERIDLIIEAKSVLSKRIKALPLGKYKFINASCFSTACNSESVDYILTDPPYGDAIQYSELSLIWNTWMGFHYDNKYEVVINPKQDKTATEFFFLLEKSVKEAARVLKHGKLYTLCFHNKEFHIWNGVLDIFKRNNFVLENVDIVDTKGNSYNTNWSTFSPKSDLYLTFRKGQYSAKFDNAHQVSEFVKRLSIKIETDDPSELYNLIAVNLIYDLYFNKYQLNVDKLDIKTIFSIYKEAKRGD